MAVNLNAIVEEIKATNWQDAGTWHAAPKALVLLAVLIGVANWLSRGASAGSVGRTG